MKKNNYIFETVPNQKTVTIKKAPCNKDCYYTTIQNDILAKAMRELKGEHFKIFMWLAANANNYKFALSTQSMSNDCNCTTKTCQTAIKSFIEKDILVETSANHYDFDEIGYGSRDSDSKSDSKTTESIDSSIQTEEISTDEDITEDFSEFLKSTEENSLNDEILSSTYDNFSDDNGNFLHRNIKENKEEERNIINTDASEKAKSQFKVADAPLSNFTLNTSLFEDGVKDFLSDIEKSVDPKNAYFSTKEIVETWFNLYPGTPIELDIEINRLENFFKKQKDNLSFTENKTFDSIIHYIYDKYSADIEYLLEVIKEDNINRKNKGLQEWTDLFVFISYNFDNIESKIKRIKQDRITQDNIRIRSEYETVVQKLIPEILLWFSYYEKKCNNSEGYIQRLFSQWEIESIDELRSLEYSKLLHIYNFCIASKSEVMDSSEEEKQSPIKKPSGLRKKPKIVKF